jgi:hypothetical protein
VVQADVDGAAAMIRATAARYRVPLASHETTLAWVTARADAIATRIEAVNQRRTRSLQSGLQGLSRRQCGERRARDALRQGGRPAAADDRRAHCGRACREDWA